MNKSIAETVLTKDFLLNIDMLECIRRESADIIFTSENGVLIQDKISKTYMLSSQDMNTAKTIINNIPQNAEMLVAHNEMCLSLLRDKFNITNVMKCNNAVYTKNAPIKLPECQAVIKLLTKEYTEIVTEHYSNSAACSPDYIRGRINAKVMFGAFINDKLCGFVGSHEEGSIGMLEVLPEYRKIGIATVLQIIATNNALAQGRYPYGQIVDGNTASMNLQKKLGFEISGGNVWWMVK